MSNNGLNRLTQAELSERAKRIIRESKGEITAKLLAERFRCSLYVIKELWRTA